MLYVAPTRDNPVYLEWRKWRHKQQATWSQDGREAQESIERIAEFLYKNSPCIVGHMIIMDDLQSMEEEAAAVEGTPATVPLPECDGTGWGTSE